MMKLALTLLAAGTLLPSASAQTATTATRISAPVKDRGTFHLATGTWTRPTPGGHASKVLYNNSAPSGYYFETAGGETAVDYGRIPSPTSPSNGTSVTGTAHNYLVDCFRVSYCSDITRAEGGLTLATSVFGAEYPCNGIPDPSELSASFLATGLPAGTSSGAQGCWTVAFDLSGTSATFSIPADATGFFFVTENTFAWTWSFPGAVSGPTGNHTGPIIAGNCPAGGVPGNPTSPQQGFGTDFGGTPGATDATGLGTADSFWLDDGSSSGCFFFGGCNPAAPAPQNPYSSMWLQVFGDETFGSVGSRYCASLVNATGSRASLTAAATHVSTDLVLTSSPVPNTTGSFYHGPMRTQGNTFLGDGLRCVGGMTARLLPFVTAGMMMQLPNTATLTIDYGAPYAAGLTSIRFFQHWFRSGLPSGNGSNTSDAIRITF